MNKPLVSVVIPIYKVEEYLSRCIESVINQTLKDIEIILVNDGSPDNCPKICDEYAKKDLRIKVIHKENGGLASARNSGMKIASGKWLFFLDSDDWLETDGLETLFETGEKYKVDFVRYRAIRTGWPGLEENAPCMVEPIRELRDGYYSKTDIEKEVYPRLIITPMLTMGAVVGAWGSLYNLEFLRKNNLTFYEDVKFSEDLVFSARVVRAAENFYFIDEPGVYHYFYNPNSISKSFRAGRWDSCKALIETCERDFKGDSGYDFKNQLHFLRWFCIFLSLGERRFLQTAKEKKDYCKAILDDKVTKETPLKLSLFDVSIKQKFFMVLVKLGFTDIVAKL